MISSRVLLDTNILLTPGLFGINLDLEINRILGASELYVPKGVVDELKQLAVGNSKDARAAKLGLAIVKHKVNVVNHQDIHTDDVIVDWANDYVVATLDKELQGRIKAKNGSLLILRAKKYFKLA